MIEERTTAVSPAASQLGKEGLLRLYEKMSLLRRFESVTQELNRKGVWPGFVHLYIGEEATAVGVCDHLRTDDWITSTHRGHGHVLAKGVPPGKVMAELYGKKTGCSGGRGGSMHMYDPPHGLLGTTGLVCGGVPVAVGAALSAKVRASGQVSVAFFGDGASNHGAFLESLNFATVQKLPVVFVCENNLYATATPIAMATANTNLAGRGPAFGCPGIAVDGNDVLAVWQAAKEAIDRARAGEGPTLIESRTYRWCGHHEGDPVCGTYRTEEELKGWKARCPIAAFRKLLVERLKLTSAQELDDIDRRVAQKVDEAAEYAESGPYPDPATIHDHVYAEPINPPIAASGGGEPAVQSWLDAVRDGIAEEMRRNPHIACLGEGIGERGGCFGHTKGLWKEFGAEHIIDTPICELAFTGAAIGASATGCRTIADMMFVDFLYEAGGQIVQQGSKLRYMSNGQISVPVVLRAPGGMIKSAGAHHSGFYAPVWGHVPGLIVVIPSSPADAKGLMKTALRASDPVVFIEHKAMFATKGPVPRGEHLIPFGVANVVRPGTDLTVVTCGILVGRCLEAAEKLQAEGLSCEVIDLRTIVPMDVQTVAESLHKTGKLLVVDEAWAAFGLGAEVTAAMMEVAFDDIDVPIGRLHTEPVHYPYATPLEDATMVTVEKIIVAAKSVAAGMAPAPRRPAVQQAKPAAQPKPVASARPVERAAPRPAVPAAEGVPLILPNMDLTVSEATVVRWLRNEGDPVDAQDPVVEVETDKAVVTVESPAAGTLRRILTPEQTVVKMGQTMAIIEPKTGVSA